MGWLVFFLKSPYSGIFANLFGLAGSVVILWAAWRSVDVRKALLKLTAVESEDPTLREVVTIVVGKLNQDQVSLIRGERQLYMTGIVLLAAAFVLSLFRDLALIFSSVGAVG
jgi:hypothetical protein